MQNQANVKPSSEFEDLLFELYGSTFCGPCRITRRHLDSALTYLPGASIVEHDIAHEPDLAAAQGIEETPTVILRTGDGSEALRATGVPTVSHILTAAVEAVTPTP